MNSTNSQYIVDPFSSAQDCPNFFSTTNESEPCQATWAEVVTDDALLAIRIVMGGSSALISVWGLVNILNIFLRRHNRSGQKLRFKRGAIISNFIGTVFLTIFYALGNLFDTTLDTAVGVIAFAMVMFSSVLIFQSCCFLLMLIQQIFLSSCGGKLTMHIVTSYKPVVAMVFPYYLTSGSATIMAAAGLFVPTDNLFPTRIGLIGVIFPVSIYAGLMHHYGTPVVKVMLDSATEMEANTGKPQDQMKNKAKLLEKQIRYAWVSTVVTISVFSFFSFSPYVNHPLVFVVFQTYLCVLLILSSIALQVVLFRESKKGLGSSKGSSKPSSKDKLQLTAAAELGQDDAVTMEKTEEVTAVLTAAVDDVSSNV